MNDSLQRTAFLFLHAFIFVGFASTLQAQNPKSSPVKARIDTTKPVAEIQTGKTPIIIIPGLTGSELVNEKNRKTVWFKPQRAKADDLRLPISENLSLNRDGLRARDIIRSVELIKFLPDIEIYQKLIDALEKRGGYTEGKWDAPSATGDRDTFYVFPYDWRYDNVENARLLMRNIDDLKRKLKRPNLKFNVIAHSMGGLIARYAAMYGDADLPDGEPRPTWAGARNFDKIFLVGTPNGGSVQALDALLHGSSLTGGINLPFIQNLSKFDIFTIPAIYQLLPHPNTFAAYDENFKPLPIDLYDPKNWEKYQWGVWQDEDFAEKFSPAEQRAAKAYFNRVLNRAKRFYEALDANTSLPTPVSIRLMGADCKDTPSAIVLLRDEPKDRWRTLFKPHSFARADGERVSADQVKKLLYAPGDGVVTVNSLKKDGAQSPSVLPIASELRQCAAHSKLVSSPEIQNKLFSLLGVNAMTAAK